MPAGDSDASSSRGSSLAGRRPASPRPIPSPPSEQGEVENDPYNPHHFPGSPIEDPMTQSFVSVGSAASYPWPTASPANSYFFRATPYGATEGEASPRPDGIKGRGRAEERGSPMASIVLGDLRLQLQSAIDPIARDGLELAQDHLDSEEFNDDCAARMAREW